MKEKYIVLSDNRKIGYEDCGDKSDSAIIMFHGTPGSRIAALEDSPLIKKFNVRFITPERPGYGISDPTANREISDWPTDMIELSDQLGIEKFHVHQ